MNDLSTTYVGLNLKNPIIVGSCGLTGRIDTVEQFAEKGAAAVVLKSLFEEQILAEFSSNLANYTADYPGATEYIRDYTRGNEVDAYLELIAGAKKRVDIPVIASINCVSAQEWVSFARSVEQAGADAIELNVSLLPANPRVTSQENEKRYLEIVNGVCGLVSIPVVLKMSHYSASLARLIDVISRTTKVGGFVLFNRHYSPDIDIEKMTVGSADIFSSPHEGCGPLRWIALMSGIVDKDLVASTGVHDSAGVIKQILAGATAVQMVTTLYKSGAEVLPGIIAGLDRWMEKNSFATLESFRGKLSYAQIEDPAVFERTQFMKFYGGIT